jgi:hypothetical protein
MLIYDRSQRYTSLFKVGTSRRVVTNIFQNIELRSPKKYDNAKTKYRCQDNIDVNSRGTGQDWGQIVRDVAQWWAYIQATITHFRYHENK